MDVIPGHPITRAHYEMEERQEYPNKRFDEAMDEKLPTVIKMRAVPNDV
jgi:hypothetical protein